MSDTARKHKDQASEYAAKGRYKAAVSELEKVLALDPGDTASRQKLGEMLVRLGKTDAAILVYETVARQYANEGLLLKAMAVCKVILELDPKHTRTQDVLGDLVERQTAIEESGSSGFTDEIDLPVTLEEEVADASDVDFEILEVINLPPQPAAEDDFSDISPTLEDEIERQFALAEAQSTAPESKQLPAMPLFSGLSAEAFAALFPKLELLNVPSGTLLVREGDPGNSMFVVVQGGVRVFHNRPGEEELTLARLGPGSFFGEMALMTDNLRIASVEATAPTALLVLSRRVLQDLTIRYPSVAEVMLRFYRARLLSNLLQLNPVFRALPPRPQMQILDRFQRAQVDPGTILLEKGRPGDGLYIILRGVCEVEGVTRADGSPVLLREGELFGEISLLLDTPVTATVRAQSTCILLRLDRRSFYELVMPHPEVRDYITGLSNVRMQENASTSKAYMV